MALQRLQITDFRCLDSLDLPLDPQLTVITGANGAGKTSVLEAMYLLGRGRSFRTRRLETLIRAGAARFIVHGQTDGTLAARFGVEGTLEGIRGRLDGKSVKSLAELASMLPVQVIDPEIHRLIEEGPVRRRQYLDWGTFHVEHDFVDQWQRYQQALRQRNAGLRAGQGRNLVSAWNEELIRHGVWISHARSRYLQQLSAPATRFVHQLLGLDVQLAYRTGWKGGSLEEALEDHWDDDFARKTTSVGPHRADLSIALEGRPVKDRISRGQQKLLAAALLIAQLSLLSSDSGRRPLLLLDDPAAELDREKLGALVGAIAACPMQVVVTTLADQFDPLGKPGRIHRLLSGALTHSD